MCLGKILFLTFSARAMIRLQLQKMPAGVTVLAHADHKSHKGETEWRQGGLGVLHAALGLVITWLLLKRKTLCLWERNFS